MISPFRNEPITDFARDEYARRAQQAALDGFRLTDFPVVINGKRHTTREKVVSINPCRPAQIVGRVSKAPRALAKRAILAAHEGFAAWAATPVEKRAKVLFDASTLLRERRWEMNAAMILETGKTWIEADADTAEAIDFLEYYARDMLRIASENLVTPIPGERNELRYLPLGTGVIIAPWNFPCAILCGMASAALVAGNAVIMKPASTAVVVGAKLFQVLVDAGAPPSVLHFLPCSGGSVGDLLVDHPLTRFISFTGSKEIGIRIYERAAKVHPGQIWLKRVVAEMGGKDAIVVDEDADLEAAATGIVASAFGYQGQKCSACSRAIIVDSDYPRVRDLVVEKTKALRIGDATRLDTQMAAVIDASQYKKVLKYIQIGRREGKLLAGGSKLPGDGYFIEPTVFGNVSPKAKIAREEIFGPVLALVRAKNYADAVRINNASEYGLTGAFYGKARAAQAKEDLFVGNLYINRKCTGALVGGHPFGGFNMSGTDSKAGGPDYLKLFLQAKAISEKV